MAILPPTRTIIDPTADPSLQYTSTGTQRSEFTSGNNLVILNTDKDILVGDFSTTTQQNYYTIQGVLEPSGNTDGALQYRLGEGLGSDANLVWDATGQLLRVNGNLVVDNIISAGVVVNQLDANINNVHIYGGTSGQFLQTDGGGNLSWISIEDPTYDVTNITRANPGVVTLSSNINFPSGTRVNFSSVVGMTELNFQGYYANVLSATTLSLYTDNALTTPLNTTSYNAYISGGVITLPGASPGGTNSSVQFNDNGVLSGSSTFRFNDTTNTLSITATIGSNLIPNANVTYNLGNSTNRWRDLYLSNNSLFLGNTKVSTDGSNNTNTADLYVNDVRVIQLAVTNTSNSTIIVGGNAPAGLTQPVVQLGANTTTVVQIGSNANANITASGSGIVLPANVTITANGVVNFSGANVNFGNSVVSNLSSISNGNSNATVVANGNIAFSASGNANILVITGNTAIANSFTSNNYIFGNATTTISTQRWTGASTTSTAANQVLYQIPAANVSSVDYHITATDGTVSRQVSKILAVSLAGTTQYTEYGGMWVNQQVADITVDQSSGNVRLLASPLTANTLQYNIVLTIYN